MEKYPSIKNDPSAFVISVHRLSLVMIATLGNGDNCLQMFKDNGGDDYFDHYEDCEDGNDNQRYAMIRRLIYGDNDIDDYHTCINWLVVQHG